MGLTFGIFCAINIPSKTRWVGDIKIKETINLSTAGLLEKALDSLGNIDGIEGKAIISRDGLIIWRDMPASRNLETVAAMVASSVGAIETATSEYGIGIPERVIIESKFGKIIVVGAGPKALLVVIATSEVSLGIILLKMQEAAEKIKGLLGPL